MEINKQSQTANLAMLQLVADKLGDLCEYVVFLGGCLIQLVYIDVTGMLFYLPNIALHLEIEPHFNTVTKQFR